MQAGAGIVADSVPDDEDLECRNKAAALLAAIPAARRMTAARRAAGTADGLIGAELTSPTQTTPGRSGSRKRRGTTKHEHQRHDGDREQAEDEGAEAWSTATSARAAARAVNSSRSAVDGDRVPDVRTRAPRRRGADAPLDGSSRPRRCRSRRARRRHCARAGGAASVTSSSAWRRTRAQPPAASSGAPTATATSATPSTDPDRRGRCRRGRRVRARYVAPMTSSGDAARRRW